MGLAPIFVSTCDLARRMPALVGDFLDIETSLRRRFREESVTDLFVAALARLMGPDLVVFFPKDEAKTGDDFDLIIVDSATREAIQYRVQAKRLKPHNTKWGVGSYPELAHPGGTGGQSLALVRSAAAEKRIKTVPLYAFYNPTRTCVASGGTVSGIELADGRAIRSLVKQLIKAKPKRPPLKRISTLQPLFFPLERLLCPNDPTGRRRVPTPSQSLLSVNAAVHEAETRYFGSKWRTPPEIRAEISARSDFRARSSVSLRYETLPPLLAVAADVRQARLERTVIPANVRRVRLVLFSGASVA